MRRGTFFAVLLGTLVFWTGTTANGQIQFQSGFSSNAGFSVLTSSTDNQATFGYDYSLDAIPKAPNGNDRIGLKLEANLTGTGGTARRLAVFPTTFTPSGNYRFSVDIWGNYSAFGSGTTEHMGAFVGHDGVTNALHGGGLIFPGEGGALQDLRLYRNTQHLFIGTAGGTQTPSRQYNPLITTEVPISTGVACDPEVPVGTAYQDCRDTNFIGFWIDRVPEFLRENALNPIGGQGASQFGFNSAGSFGFQWVTMRFDVFPNRPGPAGVTSDLGYAEVRLLFHGSIETPNVPPIETLVGTLDNSAGVGPLVNFSQKPSVVYWDIFASVASDPQFQFGIFDNFIVETIPGGVTGDFNGDNLWNCADVNDLTNAIATGSTNLAFDMNGDSQITIADLTQPTSGWLAVGGANNPAQTGGNPFRMGDANLDGKVDGVDFNIWNSAKGTNNTAWCSGNFNADTVINNLDFTEWFNNRFTSSSLVPEPSLMAAWLMLLGVGLRRWNATG